MRRTFLRLALVVGAASAIACAQTGAPPAAAPMTTMTRQAPHGATEAKRSGPAALPDAAYTSPIRIATGPMTGVLFLRATPGASRETVLQLTIAHGGYWKIFNRAVDREGHSYRTTPEDQHVTCGARGCTYYEEVAISIPEAELARAARSGLVLRISGSDTTYLADLPAAYVGDFVKGLAGTVARGAAPANDRPVPAAPAP